MQINFVDAHRWRSLAIFNPNAFPPIVRPVVDACAARLSLVLHHTAELPAALERASADFRRMIENNRADLEASIRKRPELRCVAVYDGIGFMSEMHNALNATKSFLDLYAKLIGKLINERNEWGFGKATIDDRKIAGGRFVNALRKSSKDGIHAALADTVLWHSLEWITQAVTYRDQLSHRSDLNHMAPMFLPLHADAPNIRFEDMQPPTMPNGTQLREYFNLMQTHLLRYIAETMQLAPNVDRSLVSLDGLQRDLRSPEAG